MAALRALRATPLAPRGLRAFTDLAGLGTYEAVLPEKPGSTKPNKYSAVTSGWERG